MVTEIDSELLITLVQQRPVLWDKTIDEYKDRNKTLEGWKEICRILKDDFDEISEKEQNDIGKNYLIYYTNIYCPIYGSFYIFKCCQGIIPLSLRK